MNRKTDSRLEGHFPLEIHAVFHEDCKCGVHVCHNCSRGRKGYETDKREENTRKKLSLEKYPLSFLMSDLVSKMSYAILG